MLFSNLLVRQQTLQLCYVGRICEAFLAEVALQLSGLAMAVEQVALANVTALELTVLGNGKSLFCTAVRFDLRHKVLLLSEFALYLRVGFTCPLRAPETSASGGLRAWAAFPPCCIPSTALQSD